MRPRIGIPLRLDGRGELRAGQRTLYLDVAYSQALAAAGALPLHLPLAGGPAELAAQLDGLLLPGGGDFRPPEAEREIPMDPVAPEQLAFERKLVAAARERQLPLLGICYGMQLLALVHGGSLLYHLPEDLPGAGRHQLPDPQGRHGLELLPGTRLAALMGPGPLQVNSRHHQAVASPGRGLRVSARAPDGVVEAIEGEAGGFLLGVQWHPESLQGAASERLFAAFVAACRRRREGGRRAGAEP